MKLYETMRRTKYGKKDVKHGQTGLGCTDVRRNIGSTEETKENVEKLHQRTSAS